MELFFIKSLVGIGFILLGLVALRNFFLGYGLEPSRFYMHLIKPKLATQFQKNWLLFQSLLIIIAGVSIFIIKI